MPRIGEFLDGSWLHGDGWNRESVDNRLSHSVFKVSQGLQVSLLQ